MRPLLRAAALAPAGMLAAVLLVSAAGLLAARADTLSPIDAGLIGALALVGLAGAWGALAQRPRALTLGALLFALLWIASSTWLLTREGARPANELASTIRQHGAILVLVAGAYLGGAAALGWRPRPAEHSTLSVIALLLLIVGVGAFAFGAPGRGIPGTWLAPGLGAIGAATMLSGQLRRDATTALVGAALVGLGVLAGTAVHVLRDSDLQVALLSYAGPAGLAVLPAAALALGNASEDAPTREA